MRKGEISSDEAAYLSDCQRAALGQKTAHFDIQNRIRNSQHDTQPIQNYSRRNCYGSIINSPKVEKSFQACLKADEVMKKTEQFLKKMQQLNKSSIDSSSRVV
jgi:hypothetical protein